MPRPRKYESEEQAYEVKKKQARARYWVKKGTTEREKVRTFNHIITLDDVGLTIAQLKEKLKQTTQVPQAPPPDSTIPKSEPTNVENHEEEEVDHPGDYEDIDGEFLRRLENDEEFRKEIEANEEEARQYTIAHIEEFRAYNAKKLLENQNNLS
jgi:hypothetical protein